MSALSLPIDFVRAPRGLLDQPEGLYTPATVAAWAERMPSLRTQKATDVNHYTIVMSPAGVTQLLPVLTRHFAPS
ncbi:hypothetical protein [Leifsonia poae]|uniref:hypothetical protein n=1 Tax=Leifsonia poae TaxID=110933 RepID=UPI001CC024F0|nr:hypothetical protein [Leifsonia poae]